MPVPSTAPSARRARIQGVAVGATVALLLLAAVGIWVGVTGTGTSPAAASVGGGSVAACPQATGATLPRSELPSDPIACLDGTGSARLDAIAAGRPTIVNVWGSWCPPCRDELPWFAALDDRANGAVQVVGVAVMDTVEGAQAAVRDLGVHYPVLFDPAGVTRGSLRWTSGTPVTLFVRPDGTIAYQVVGRVEDAAALAGMVQQYLGVTV